VSRFVVSKRPIDSLLSLGRLRAQYAHINSGFGFGIRSIRFGHLLVH
jgi:hypothetical protein